MAYTAWPDHGVPQSTTELLMLRTQIHELAVTPGVPIVVHCSAGVGRTGTLIGLDQLLDQCLHMDAPLDVDAVCRDMRLARNMMVQTEEQYLCVHAALLDGLSMLMAEESAKLKSGLGMNPMYDNYQAAAGTSTAPCEPPSPAEQTSGEGSIPRALTLTSRRGSDNSAVSGFSESSVSSVFPGYQLAPDDSVRLKSVRRENPVFRELRDRGSESGRHLLQFDDTGTPTHSATMSSVGGSKATTTQRAAAAPTLCTIPSTSSVRDFDNAVQHSNTTVVVLSTTVATSYDASSEAPNGDGAPSIRVTRSTSESSATPAGDDFDESAEQAASVSGVSFPKDLPVLPVSVDAKLEDDVNHTIGPPLRVTLSDRGGALASISPVSPPRFDS